MWAACQAVACIAANEGLEDEGLCAACDRVPSKDAVRRKTRLRDELFQDLMKVCLPATTLVTAKAHGDAL